MKIKQNMRYQIKGKRGKLVFDAAMYQTFKYQVELLPRITIIYESEFMIGVEWLWFGFYIRKS